MAGIYLHIPFCKKACTYCDFHFSTSLKNYQIICDSLLLELSNRAGELKNEKINSIYFGGGTPSLLQENELKNILNSIRNLFDLSDEIEISLEANPDDLSTEKLEMFYALGINRLSIGIQSFNDADLLFMNRSHTAKQAQDCVQTAQKIGFNNITIDLIYGLPNATLADWEQNIEKALALDIQHISAYCLTVENKTLLHNQVKKGIVKLPSDESSLAQFKLLITKLEQQGFIQYEISNFGKSGYFSLHNSNYWKREKYLGIGPSAHSYSGKERRWNIANNAVYSKNLQNGESYFETEILSEANCINEYILTRLRTIWGIDIVEFENLFGKKAASTLQVQLDTWLAKNALLRNQNIYTLSLDGKFIADYIASELFVLE